MTPLISINNFLAPKKMAFVGISRNPKKFSYQVFKELSDKGFDLYPVNPNCDVIDNKKCYKSVSALPGGIVKAFVITPKKETANVVSDLADKGITNIWIQQSAETPEAIEIAKAKGVDLIYKECIMMFATPVKSIHSFHKWLWKIFGKHPK